MRTELMTFLPPDLSGRLAADPTKEGNRGLLDEGRFRVVNYFVSPFLWPIPKFLQISSIECSARAFVNLAMAF
jgi:hypothetical protein